MSANFTVDHHRLSGFLLTHTDRFFVNLLPQWGQHFKMDIAEVAVRRGEILFLHVAWMLNLKLY